MEKGRVLIFRGGWDGHEPQKVSERFARIMEDHGYSCRIYDDQEALSDLELVMAQDLIIPCGTMGTIEQTARENIVKAVAAGTGLAGCHGGMCDAFREDVEWQFMTGGQWVSHPGGDGVSYRVQRAVLSACGSCCGSARHHTLPSRSLLSHFQQRGG